ncbi:trypsin-like peptidase domain-containing protein [Dactylosporangium sp. NPDC050588]|uniref:trypsin-like peptidase domain-containing protein n=1 Tax=Dactylosporangium sp. NPDC050588 TaxID=3157211 RepID=UPI0033F48F14
MTAVPLASRLVEVIAELGDGRPRYGSGCIVAGRTVLTAAHVVAGAVSVTIRDVRKITYAAFVDPRFTGDPYGPGPDLALLEAATGAPELEPVGLARVDRDAPAPTVIEGCHAYGYPGFAEVTGDDVIRETVDAVGVVAPLSKLASGLLSMVVTITPAELDPRLAGPDDSPWSGMSGAPVIAHGRLFGVVVEHGRLEGSSAVTVVPLTALEADPGHPRWGPGVADPAGWWSRLGVTGIGDLSTLTGTAGLGATSSAYLAQVARIAPTELLDREQELTDLREFCVAPGRGPYLWLRAPAWVGKSALMAWFVLHPPQGVRIVSFFVTARLARQDDSVAFADVVLEQLLTLLGHPVPPLLTEATRESFLLTKLDEAAAVCQARGERLVLVVDGLDEDRGTAGPDGHSIAALLPARPVAGLRVVVTGRPHPPLPPDVPPRHALRDPAIVVTLTQSPHAAGIRERAQGELKRLLTADGPDRDLLALVAAAGGGLSAGDLAELTDLEEWQVRDRLGAVPGRTFAVRQGTWHAETATETYVLGHEELQLDAIALLGPRAIDGYRQRLTAWADGYHHRDWPADTPSYLLQGYFALLRTTHEVDQLVELATSPARHARLLARSGADSAALTEIAMTQEALLTERRRNLVALARLAVHHEILARRNRNIPVELPALWARLGLFVRAEALAQSIPDREQRQAALDAVADVAAPSRPTGAEDAVLDTLEPDPRADVELLIEAAGEALNVGARARAAELLTAAEEAADTSTDPGQRAELRKLVKAARKTARRRAAEPSTDLVDRFTADRFTFKLLAEAAAAEGAFDRAEALAASIHDRRDRSETYASIARHLVDAAQLDRAERLAQLITTDDGRALTLRHIATAAVIHGDLRRAQRIAAVQEPGVLVDVARTAHEHGNARWGRRILTDAVTHAADAGSWERFTALMPALAELDGVEQGLALAFTVPDPVRRMSAVAAVAASRNSDDTTRAALAAAMVWPVTRDSWEWDAWVGAVRTLAASGGVVEAEAAARLALPGGDAQALVAVAAVKMQRGDPAGARASLADAVDVAALPPTHGRRDVLNDALRSLAELGAVDQASAAARRAHDYWRRDAALASVVDGAVRAGRLDEAARVEALMGVSFDRSKARQRILSAHLDNRDYASAVAYAERFGEGQSTVRTAMHAALDNGDLSAAADLARGTGKPELLIPVADEAIERGDPERARVLLEEAETGTRSAPDPQWQVRALTTAAWALTADLDRMLALTSAAEHAARRISDPTAQAAALVEIAAVADAPRATALLDEAAALTTIPCTWAEAIAARAGDPQHLNRVLDRLTQLVSVIANPHDRVRAAQTTVETAIGGGELDKALAAARSIEHPDQLAYSLIDVARAGAESGRFDWALEVSAVIGIPDRQTDALVQVAGLAAAKGDLGIAQRAAALITVPFGRAAAVLATVRHAAADGDLDVLSGLAARIDEPASRRFAQQIIATESKARAAAGRAGRSPRRGDDDLGRAEAAAHAVTEPLPRLTALLNVIARARTGGRLDLIGALVDDVVDTVRTIDDPDQHAAALLRFIQTVPEHPSCADLIAETLRDGPATTALDALARIHRPAATAAADELLTLLV